jgi:hypothetical protein
MIVPTLVAGQIGEPRTGVNSAAKQLANEQLGTAPFHASAYLASLPEGKSALAEFRAWKAAGALERRSSSASKQAQPLGTQQLFSVYNFKTTTYENIDFTLKKDEARFTIWVETALLNGTVSDQKIDELDVALRISTPAGSYNPAAGIIVNDETIFGDPPDRDLDGKTDIMLLDIRDDASQGFVILGFFDPRDLGTSGNQRDIVYLDTNPGLLLDPETVLATAAHEYQHLIMANYDGTESTFVNEAQSEWSELMNGYNGRDMDFLGELAEHRTPFFRYREDVGGLLDRERGQLFTLYLAEQLGPEIAGAVTRQTGRSQVGYARPDVLGSIAAFESLVADFHVANLFNDTSLGSKYGYVNPYYTNVRTNPDVVVDGRLDTSLAQTSISLEGGAVRYVQFNDVNDLIVSIDVNPNAAQNVPSFRARSIVRAYLERQGVAMEEVSFPLDGSDLFLPGEFDRVTLVVVNGRAQDPLSPVVPYLYSATWSAESSGILVSVTYDNGNPAPPYYTTDGTLVQMTRFTVPDPDKAALDVVSLAPLFDNQFGNSTLPSTAPRDIKLLVLDQTNGEPDLTKEIFSLEITDPRSFFQVAVGAPLSFFDVDLKTYSGQLSNLPDEVFVGFMDSGTDQNFTTLTSSSNSVDNVSYLGFTNSPNWSPLWDVNLDESCCNHRLVPVRAQFLVSNVVGVDEDGALPASVTLLQNYPNPFAASTDLTFELSEPMAVEIKLFDVLGREVSTIASGMYATGRHTAVVDGSRLSRGMYLYRLRAGSSTLTRTMIRS